MVTETVTMEGHLIDSDILRKAFARVVEGGGDFEILEFKVGKTNDDPSFLRMSIKADAPDVVDRILEDLSYLGATAEGPAGRGHGKKRAAKALVQNVRFAPSEADGILPDEFKIFTNINSTVIDPKKFDPRSFVDVKGDVCIIPPNSFALARTVEYFRIPRTVLTICVGKSTYARCGIIVNVTPFEPGWEGRAVLEISNSTPLPARIYANEGIAQVLFFEGDEPCEVSYADKKGKYQAQKTLTLPKL